MDECIFCKIIEKELPADIVYEDSKVFAFNDINPQAPVHVLIVPRAHIESIREINEHNSHYLLAIHHAANEIAQKLGIYNKGYRLITNVGKDAGQSVPHLHYHMLGGKNLGPKIL